MRSQEVPRPDGGGHDAKELAENSAFMMDRPSETIVAVPTVLSVALVLDRHAEVGAGLLHRRQL